MQFLFLDMLDVLGYIKSWPALYSELKRLHVTDVVTDSEECSDVTVYVKNHNPSWQEIARAAYFCGEEAVMEKVFKCERLFSELHIYERDLMLMYNIVHAGLPTLRD